MAGIIAELGSFSSYQNAKQLIKMAGSNPTDINVDNGTGTQVFGPGTEVVAQDMNGQ